MLRMLQEDQREILQMMEQSRQLLQNPDDVNPSMVDQLRWRFDRLVARHIHSLKTEVGPWAARSRPDAVNGVNLVASLAQDLSASYEQHKARHTSGEIRLQPAEYTTSANALMVKIHRLLQEESATLFPLLPS